MQQISILDYGAKADGSLCTKAIQQAIDACFTAGGGTVEVPAGEFLTGGIRLRSNITLLLRAGARLKGTRDPEDYMAFLSDPLEPLPDALRCDQPWLNALTRQDYEFIRRAGSRWNNGLIRAIGAEHVAIIGEEGACIDGADCYDEAGEEHYRGPHGISMHFCRDLRFSGYTIQNTGNWAHALFDSQDISVSHVVCLAGHDGVHMTTCDRIHIADCQFYTGDDCVAGIDNTELTVQNCIMNTACSAFRLGGTGIRIKQCKLYGPAKYLFRGSLSTEEKRAGKSVPMGGNHRYNMLSAYTYYADFSRPIRQQPGDIWMEDCQVDGVDRFLHYNYSGNETWQRNRPLEQIGFRRIQVTDLRMPLTLYGDAQIPVTCQISQCDFAFAPETQGVPFLHLCHYRRLTLENVRVRGLKDAPLIKRWSSEGILDADVDYQDAQNPRVVDTQETFQCKPI